MKRTLLLISFATATILAALQHGALAQQPTPPTRPAASAPDKKNTPPPKSGKKAPAKAAGIKDTAASITSRQHAAPPVVEIMPMDLPPPASNAPPAPVSPGAGSIASGITPVRYWRADAGSLPADRQRSGAAAESGSNGGGAVGAPGSTGLNSDGARRGEGDAVHSGLLLSPPVPGRKPAQGQTQTVETPAPTSSPATTPPAERNRRRPDPALRPLGIRHPATRRSCRSLRSAPPRRNRRRRTR